MKLSKILLSAAFLSMGMTAMAQATYTDKEGTEYQFKKHAFLNLEGGAHLVRQSLINFSLRMFNSVLVTSSVRYLQSAYRLMDGRAKADGTDMKQK